MDKDFANLLLGVFEKHAKVSRPSPSVCLGTDVNSGESLDISIDELSSTHTYVPGSSGVGKTRFLLSLTQQIMKLGYGCVVLDGKAGEDSLFSYLRDFSTRLELEGSSASKKTFLIDPTNDKYSVGINYLQLMGEQSPDDLASLIVEAFKKFFGEDTNYQPWLEEWLPPALVPLIEAKLTLLELSQFLNVEDPRFRYSVLSKLEDRYYRDKWDSLLNFRPQERAMRVGSIQTRADTFQQSKRLKVLFGQQETSIDWLKIMNEGGRIFANLGRSTKLGEKAGNFIGAAILHQFITVAPLRPAHNRRPFFFIVDEFQKFVTRDFADALDRMRGYGISFVLAHQHRKQFEEVAPEVLHSIDANCRNKIIFACQRDDSEDLARDVFSGVTEEGAKEVKDEIRVRAFAPVKTYEEVVTHSESESYSRTDSVNEGDSHSKSKGVSTSKAKGTSTSTSHGESDGVSHSKTKGKATTVSHGRASTNFTGWSRGTATTITPNISTDPLDVFFGGGGELVTDSEGESGGRAETESHAEAYTESESETKGTTKTKSSAVGFSESEVDTIGENESEGESHTLGVGRADTEGHTSGKSVSIIPSLDYEEYEQLSSRTFYGLEEVRERQASQIRNQPDRHAYWKFLEDDPVHLVTPTIEPDIVTESARNRFEESVYQQTAVLKEEVIEGIKSRVPQFMREIEDTKKESTENTKGSAGPTDDELNEPI